MVKHIHCQFCGRKYFLFSANENPKRDVSVTCPCCGRMCRLGKLKEIYSELSPATSTEAGCHAETDMDSRV